MSCDLDFRGVDAPMVTLPRVPIFRDIRVRLTSSQARVFRQLFDGLQLAGERRGNGREITRPHHAIEWVVDQLALAAEREDAM